MWPLRQSENDLASVSISLGVGGVAYVYVVRVKDA